MVSFEILGFVFYIELDLAFHNLEFIFFSSSC